MPVSHEAATIARRLQEVIGDGRNVLAYIDFLGSLWADELLVTHVPPMTNDGPRVGPELRVREVAMNEQFLEAMPDYRQESVAVHVEGPVVRLRMTWTGTRSDGMQHRVPVDYALTVSGGLVTHCSVTLDPDDIAKSAEVGVAHWMGDVVKDETA